jgi:hypothetical protein
MAIGSGKRFQYFTEQISGAGVGRTRATWRFWRRPVSPRTDEVDPKLLRLPCPRSACVVNVKDVGGLETVKEAEHKSDTSEDDRTDV